MSPLFAIEAEKLLNQGKIQEAIDLCLEGLVQYPKYASAEAVLARAYKLSGDDEKADETLAKALEENPLNRTFRSIKQHDFVLPEPPSPPSPPIQKIKRKKKKKKKEEVKVEVMIEEENIPEEIIPEKIIPEIIKETLATENEVEILEPIETFDASEELEISAADKNLIPGLEEINLEINESEIEINFENIENVKIVENKIDVEFISTNRIQDKILEFKNRENLKEELKEKSETIEIIESEELDPIEKLALELEDAKIIPSDSTFPDPFEEDSDFVDLVENNKKEDESAVTETIAELYYEQGALPEAEKTYRTLAKLYPDDAKKFRAKARKIKKEIKK